MATTAARRHPSPAFGLVVAAVLVVVGILALIAPSAAQSEPTTTTAAPTTTVDPATTVAPTAPTTAVSPTTAPATPAAPTPPAATEAAATEAAVTEAAGVQDVLLVGDSIMNSTGPSLGFQLGNRYRVHNEGQNGSGLLTPQGFNWPAHLRSSLPRVDPDIAVLLMIGNYTATPSQFWRTPTGAPIRDVYDPAFARAWGRQADRMVTTMLASGARVVLVLPPPMISPRVQQVTNRLRAEYRAVARRHRGVTLVDATRAIGGPNGEWVATKPSPRGGTGLVRTADTVHLDVLGQYLVAEEIRLGITRGTGWVPTR